MADFVKTLAIEKIIRDCGLNPAGNFEATYSEIHRAGITLALNALDEATHTYFAGLQLPDTPTLYDYLVLSLRPKDLIVTFNWDPLLIQAYKRWRHLGKHLPQVAFLHGNVDLGVDYEKKVSGFLSDEPWKGRNLIPSRLLFPVAQKNYQSDLFIADQWRRATEYLAHAYYVTVFGYSAPTTDVEARSLLLKAWTENPTRELAEIDVIDIRDHDAVRESWSDFIVRSHGAVWANFDANILMRHPRRSCESFAFATLQQDPWRERPFPAAHSLDELEAWIVEVIAEEESGKLTNPAERQQ
jgi:hypothetical protein